MDDLIFFKKKRTFQADTRQTFKVEKERLPTIVFIGEDCGSLI